MANETVLSNRDELADEGVRLNPGAVPYCDLLLDLNKWTDKHIRPEGAAVKIAGLYDGAAIAEDDADNSRLVSFEVSRHHSLASPAKARVFRLEPQTDLATCLDRFINSTDKL